ncbi:MAG TPA: hypothetical protein VL527_02840, partial [Dongiaceae bacterium]|nr:hypothetical protein [Dongiaceae bacterium]
MELHKISEFAKRVSKNARALYALLQDEAKADLEIPELSAISKADVLELIDWELERGKEKQKMFGVEPWQSLVAIAGIIWAMASVPSMQTATGSGV